MGTGVMGTRVMPSEKRRLIGACLPSLGGWIIRGEICLKTEVVAWQVEVGVVKNFGNCKAGWGVFKHDHGAAGMGVVSLRVVIIGCLSVKS